LLASFCGSGGILAVKARQGGARGRATLSRTSLMTIENFGKRIP